MISSMLAAAIAFNPYGACAHITRSENTPYRVDKTLTAMSLAGMGYVRADFDTSKVLDLKSGEYDFSSYDSLFDEVERRGFRLLPIFYGLERGCPGDMAKYAEYLQTTLTHYRGRFPVVEIWNEPNLAHYFRGADPAAYTKTLKAAYEAIKSADPSVRVMYAGVAGIPFDWIKASLEEGAGNYFDVMNVHPYTQPRAPEGLLDVRLELLRDLMAQFNVADKPIWMSEMGFPTHSQTFRYPSILLAGLKVARPEQKAWNILIIDCAEAGVPDQTLAWELLDLLPAGSQVRVVNQTEAVRLLESVSCDAVVYPVDETFPADTIDAVNAFIDKGGVFVDMGGVPCYFGKRGVNAVEGMQDGAMLGRFPFGFGAGWSHGGIYPDEVKVFPTEAGLAAGVKDEPNGLVAKRYLRPDRAGEHEWIPLVSAKPDGGLEKTAAVVIRYKGARKGAAVLCSLFLPKGVAPTNNEYNQALYMARSLGISFAEGVEAFFAYNLRAKEDDPGYSEDHFGLMHADFQPKPAYSAYTQFTRLRPPGSVNLDEAWHNEERTFYYPQWKLPDGKFAGMIWKTGDLETREVAFEGGTPSFTDVFGRRMRPHSLGGGTYILRISGSPIYFKGARLVKKGPAKDASPN